MEESEQRMRRYLLGELSELEQSALEKEYFTDSQFFDQMLKTENELVDDYVRGWLSKEVRERFEQFYLAHPERRERVKFAAALASKLDQIEEAEQAPRGLSTWQKFLLAIGGQRPTLRLALALATLLVMVASVWILVERQRKHERELAQAERRERESQQIAGERRPPEEAQGRVEPSPQETPPPTQTPVRSSGTTVSLALTVGGVRGGDSGRTPTLVIPQDTTQARLILSLKDNDYPSYNVSLQTVAGAEIFNQRNVRPRGVRFVFTVPADRLESGDYILTLRGVGPDGKVDDLSKSLFRVEKR